MPSIEDLINSAIARYKVITSENYGLVVDKMECELQLAMALMEYERIYGVPFGSERPA